MYIAFVFSLSQQAQASEYLRGLGSSKSPHASWNFADAQIKYSYLLRTLDSLDLAPSIRILDLGCGDGHLAQTLAILGYTNVVGVDRARRRIIKDRPGRPLQVIAGSLRKVRKLPWDFSLGNYEFIRMNALEYLQMQDDQAFDVVLDGCSMTHFDVGEAGSPWDQDVNLGFVDSLLEIRRILKPHGFLISAMDVLVECSPVDYEQKEFFTERSLRRTVEFLFREVKYDEHPTAWTGLSEPYKFLVRYNQGVLTLGVCGYVACP